MGSHLLFVAVLLWFPASMLFAWWYDRRWKRRYVVDAVVRISIDTTAFTEAMRGMGVNAKQAVDRIEEYKAAYIRAILEARERQARLNYEMDAPVREAAGRLARLAGWIGEES